MRILYISLIALAATGCVGKKKYRELEQAKNALDNSLLQTRQDLAATQRQNADLRAQNQGLQGDLDAAKAQYAKLQEELRLAQNEYKQCLDKIHVLGMNKSQLEKDLLAREARVRELENALAERDAKLKALRDRIMNALTGISSADLTVEERGGRIYVSLSQKLLFKTGSAVVGKEGRDALAKLAAVLAQQTDLQILVEGHTDSDGEEQVNWRLSSERSLSITYILVENKVQPERVTAAGRGEFVPIAPNTTEEGKAKNRRTDIILTPNLEELWKIINN